MSDNTVQKPARATNARLVIGSVVTAAIMLIGVMAIPGKGDVAAAPTGERPAYLDALDSQAEELAEESASRRGCDLTKDLRIINAQYGTVGYEQTQLARAAALEQRVPAVHAVVALVCMNQAEGTEEQLFQQVIVGLDSAADETRCSGIQSVTKYDAVTHKPTGYAVDFDPQGNGNDVAKLRGACDFQKS